MISRRKFMQMGMATAGTALLPYSATTAAAPSGYGIYGTYAPELKVDYWIDAAGEPTDLFRLADHSDKWILLKCFQSWCPGCHSHGLPAVQKISHALKGNQKIAFAGIQTVFEGHMINTVDKVREIQLQYDLQMPMGHDPGGPEDRPYTMLDYRTGGTPWIIVISPERTVVFNDFHINADKAIEFLQQQTA